MDPIYEEPIFFIATAYSIVHYLNNVHVFIFVLMDFWVDSSFEVLK